MRRFAKVGLCIPTVFFFAAMQTGCANHPAEVREIKVPVPVTVSCPAVSKPEMAKPKDESRVEWLRALLINYEHLSAYAKELEQTLDACR